MSVVEFDLYGVLLEQVLSALDELKTAVAGVTAPTVNIPPMDLAEVVTAVNALRPGASAEEIAQAVKDALAGTGPDLAPVLLQITDTLGKLEWASRAPNAVVGGGVMNLPPHMVSNNMLMVSDPDVKRGITDFESRLDYASRTDTQPVYVGRAAEGTATGGVWTIEKVTYDATDRPTRKQVLIGAWDDRATLAW